jgi:signal transduction histidine kinase
MTSASDGLYSPAGPVGPDLPGDQEASGDIAAGLVPTARGPLVAPLMARTIVSAVFLSLCAISFVVVLQAGANVGQLLLSACLVLALLLLQTLYFSRPRARLGSPLAYVALAAQACLAYIPWLEFGDKWSGLLAFLGGTVLLVFRPVPAGIAFAAVVVSSGWLQWSATHVAIDAYYNGVATFIVALEVYSLTRLAGVISELHEARSELANAAVAEERLRFARDLHELLGLSLSAIAPRGELAYRLVGKDPERARQELSEILDVSRRALANVREVAHGYRDLNLDEESRTAESVLASSRVEVRMELNHGELPVPVRSLLVVVLREGVANVLEHSDAERCDVIMRQSGDRVCLDIVNDGVEPDSVPPGPVQRGGLKKLAERVAAVGGELTAGLEPDDRFRLRLTVPVAPAEPGEHEVDAEAVAPRRAALLARALLVAVLCGSTLLAALRLAGVTDAGQSGTYWLTVGCMLALLAIQLLYFSRPNVRLRSGLSYLLLAVQAVLVYLPSVAFDVPGHALPGFLAGSALLVLPAIPAWTTFAGVAVANGLVQISTGGLAVGFVFGSTGALISGLATFGLTWMVRSVTELRAARIRLAQAAVAEERVRFARDLHDLLGLSLSAITLKSELAQRLVTVAPDKARDELTEILAISRLALADVRLVASGYRELSLQEESRSAESLLAAADVAVRIELRHGELPEQVGSVLATVLREGVTNVLRHSKGERCEITLEQRDHVVYLDIVNDGVVDSPVLNRSGSGIHNLSYRVALLGGELTAGVEPDGRFRLRAKVPA